MSKIELTSEQVQDADSGKWIVDECTNYIDIPNLNRLARIERWAGMAMQGVINNPELCAYGDVAKYAFTYAEAMEA